MKINPYDLGDVARADKLSPAEKGQVVMRADLSAMQKRIKELEATCEALRTAASEYMNVSTYAHEIDISEHYNKRRPLRMLVTLPLEQVIEIVTSERGVDGMDEYDELRKAAEKRSLQHGTHKDAEAKSSTT